MPPAPGTSPRPSSGSESNVSGAATTWPANAGNSIPEPAQCPWRYTVERARTASIERPMLAVSRTRSRAGRVVERAELVEVATGAEHRTVAAQLDGRDRRISGRNGESLEERVTHGSIQCVAHMRPVEDDLESVLLACHQYRRLGLARSHPSRPSGTPARELGPRLQDGVRRRLRDQSVGERPVRRATQQQRERDGRDRVRVDAVEQVVERDHVWFHHGVEMRRSVRSVDADDHAGQRGQRRERCRTDIECVGVRVDDSDDGVVDGRQLARGER